MLGFLPLVLAAHAQDTDLLTAPAHDTDERTMEANLRIRQLSVPNSIMDAWFYDQEDGAPYPRPKIAAMAYGAEFVLRPRPANWIFYFEYLKSGVDEGLWDDVENDEPIDHDDGDWVRPENMGAVVLGATIQNEYRFTPDGATVGAAMLFGGGLGITFVTGNLRTWHDGTNPDNTDTSCLPTSQSWDRVDECADDGNKRVPRVLPMLDVSLSGKLDYKDMAHLRLDLGLHDMLFFGLAAGAAF